MGHYRNFYIPVNGIQRLLNDPPPKTYRFCKQESPWIMYWPPPGFCIFLRILYIPFCFYDPLETPESPVEPLRVSPGEPWKPHSLQKQILKNPLREKSYQNSLFWYNIGEKFALCPHSSIFRRQGKDGLMDCQGAQGEPEGRSGGPGRGTRDTGDPRTVLSSPGPAGLPSVLLRTFAPKALTPGLGGVGGSEPSKIH